ncbi:putative amidohydrolase YtcJ [Rhizobium sp. SG_E_25_P2]|uniref:amidohydrolase n=1 Tax=Rhizobium sp. SG_E_25_P2 TaxID=2879942 RepID=UPI002474C272|nr:amidohydrolase [Rhizobium sp. SG_E_25_P2]MDH6265899.1 putative amidohydrolase YtcJ [Rhizobium sp. SG_E_25_P2]
MTASIIFINAHVLTMDDETPRAGALAIEENRILAVGDRDLVMSHAGPDTRIVDANGASLLPGFVESHLHLFSGAYGQTLLQLANIMGFEAMKAAVEAFSAARPHEGLLFAQGADYEILGKGTRLDRHALDAMCPDRPLAVMAYDFHTLFANTAALKAAGLLNGKSLPVGNEVVMGEDGLATGELREKFALLPVLDLRTSGGREMLGMSGVEPPQTPTPEEWREDVETLKSGMRFVASKGITSMHNMDGNRHLLELLSDVEKDGELLARISVPFHLTREMPLSELERASAMTRDFSGDKLSCGRVKIFVDGVIESGTAAMLAEYSDRPGLRGDPIFDAESFKQAAIEADRRGLQIAVHAIGDAAVRITLDGYQAAREANGPRDSRHRIEHVEMIDPADIGRFAELGVVASVQPLHAPVGETPTSRSIGPERAAYAYAWKMLHEAGATIAFSSDWPIVPIDPLLGIQTALTRKPHLPGLPDQRLGLHDVLAAFTRNGAYVGHMDDKIGTLKPGMLADLVLLSGDIEATPAEEIAALEIRMTVCDGRVTHEAA